MNDAVYPGTFDDLLRNYQTAVYQLNHARGMRSDEAVRAFGREVRRFEAAINDLVEAAGGLDD